MTDTDKARTSLAQPAARADEDTEAKRLAWVHYCAVIPVERRVYETPDAYWKALHISDRGGWRAVATKEAGDA